MLCPKQSNVLHLLRKFKTWNGERYLSTKKSDKYDIVIVGGGIVGMATARELKMRYPKFHMAVVEKENKLAYHQSGHNSGVIHAGIYYKPGSLKAKLCVEGLHLSYKYFEKEGIPYKKCGKLIVAVKDREIQPLMDLLDRATQNNVPDIQLIEGNQIKDYEPHCQGVKALWSPHTGIVDWGLVTQHYGKNFTDAGGDVYLNFEVNGFEESTESGYNVTVKSKNQDLHSRYVLTCGGLQSDLLAKMSGCSGDPQIIPFRGEYLLLKKEKSHLVRTNIYPVPDPRFPFLGVHFTPRMNGDIWLGPNAILALKREGYGWGDIDLKEFFEALKFRGFQKLALNFITVGISEISRSLFPSLQVRQLKRYIPEISARDVTRGPTGVRAQAMNSDGQLEDDFVFNREKGCKIGSFVLHCRNAPSPGATSSLAIAKMIADKCKDEFNL